MSRYNNCSFTAGKILTLSNVTAGDSTDESGRQRFYPLSVLSLVYPDDSQPPDWFWQLTGSSKVTVGVI